MTYYSRKLIPAKLNFFGPAKISTLKVVYILWGLLFNFLNISLYFKSKELKRYFKFPWISSRYHDLILEILKADFIPHEIFKLFSCFLANHLRFHPLFTWLSKHQKTSWFQMFSENYKNAILYFHVPIFSFLGKEVHKHLFKSR